MLALFGSAGFQIIGGAIAIGGLISALMWFGRGAGEDHAAAKAAAQDTAAQDDVIARQKAMASAQENAPRDEKGVVVRLDRGTF